MRPGSNSTTARPRIREQHTARLNARPHKRVNVRKPFEVRVRARFRVRTRHFESVSAYYLRLCDSSRCFTSAVRSAPCRENVRAFCAVRSLDAKNVWLAL